MAVENLQEREWRLPDVLLLAVSFIPAAILTWGIHEWGHWFTGELLGYDMWMTLNQAGPVHGEYGSIRHSILVATAGPMVTWLQAVLAFLVVRRHQELWTYSFLFLTFWMRALAACISLISRPNDEARVSLLLGLPIWILPLVSVLLLLALTYSGSRSLQAGWKGNVTAWIMASLVTGAVIASDQLLLG